MAETTNPDVEYVVRLTPPEFHEIRRAQALLEQSEMSYRMLATAVHVLWDRLGEKYHLTPEIEYDASTGVLFRRVPPAPNGASGEPSPERTEVVGVARNDTDLAPPQASTKRRRRRKGK